MFIAIVGPIATADLLSKEIRSQYPTFPKGRAGAPLISTLVNKYLRRGHRVLAITIGRLLTDTTLYCRLSTSAIQNVVHRFSTKTIADQYLALYQSTTLPVADEQPTRYLFVQTDQ